MQIYVDLCRIDFLSQEAIFWSFEFINWGWTPWCWFAEATLQTAHRKSVQMEAHTWSCFSDVWEACHSLSRHRKLSTSCEKTLQSLELLCDEARLAAANSWAKGRRSRRSIMVNVMNRSYRMTYTKFSDHLFYGPGWPGWPEHGTRSFKALEPDRPWTAVPRCKESEIACRWMASERDLRAKFLLKSCCKYWRTMKNLLEINGNRDWSKLGCRD